MTSTFNPIFPTSIIKFDAPNNQYLPGQTVSGSVTFLLNKVVYARFVRITWQRKLKTKFFEVKGTDHKVEHHIDPWKASNDQNKLSPGTYMFPFSFKINEDSLPSFVGKAGHIKYSVKLEINRMTEPDIRFKETFYVTRSISEENINNNNNELTIFKAESIAKNRFTQNGLVEIEITPSQKLFEPGQTTEVQIVLKNHCSVDIDKLRVDLLQQSHYHARPLSAPCTKITKDHCPAVKEHQKNRHALIGNRQKINFHVAKWSQGTYKAFVEVPQRTTPTFQSRLMTVGYYLRVKVYTKGVMQLPVSFKMEVIVGKMNEVEQVEESMCVEPSCPSACSQ